MSTHYETTEIFRRRLSDEDIVEVDHAADIREAEARAWNAGVRFCASIVRATTPGDHKKLAAFILKYLKGDARQ